MSHTTRVMEEIREDRRKREADVARWVRFHREANPPAWVTALLVIAVLGGMLALAEYLLGHPSPDISYWS